ncbi:MAG: o-succinylbenzoate synthase [Thermonemataceae bacterium]|nr:o-succinylbenzoate synthase [Thermonemataceae bacterium]
MIAKFSPYTLDFKFEAGTSRGSLSQKNNFFISLQHPENPDCKGIGEINVLKGLSIDDREDLVSQIAYLLQKFERQELHKNDLQLFPAIRFALETAQKDLANGGKRLIYATNFERGEQKIPINGLVWMGKKEFMLTQIHQKIEAGYTCIKMKVGAINFKEELDLLRVIRKNFSEKEIILRVDANGAFLENEALEKLKRLSELALHSIEQPIATKQYEKMAELCEKSPVPIALDEELIGIWAYEDKKRLLEQLKPAYIILKPALLGGFEASEEWIEIAEKQGIGWWVTSALESNIGLNAIAQWTSHLAYQGHQGLGTGQLYTNNIGSPLFIEKGFLGYDVRQKWQEISF